MPSCLRETRTLWFRFVRAYLLTLLVLASYLKIWLKGSLFGKGWIESRLDEAHRRNARRISGTILQLKGLFIKVGQMLSIMSNFLPESLRSGLEGLQDAVPPHPYQAISERILQEFGKRPEELFLKFDPEPIASASLGQVHRAELPDGTKVAVKIQYPEIEAIVQTDLKILKRIFGVLHFFFPFYGLKLVYEEIAEVILHELDYEYEAQNLEKLKKNFSQEPGILFPDVFWDYSTHRVLTLRFMEGVKISLLGELKRLGVDPTALATRLIHAYCKQIFLDGVYHADPHPGNLLVQPGGKIVLVDFGAMACVSEPMQKGMARFAEGLIKRDTRLLAQSMREMGFVAREQGMEPFEKLVEYFYGKLANLKVENFKNLNLAQMQSLEELLEIKKLKISFKELMNSFHVPKDWILLERTMLLVFGLCTHLDPALNPVTIVLPYVEKFVLKDRSIAEVVLSLTKEIGLSYLLLPHEIQKTLRRLNDGILSIKNRDVSDQTQRLYLLGHQILYGILALGMAFLGLRMTEVGMGEESRYAYGGAVLFGSILIGSFLKNRKV